MFSFLRPDSKNKGSTGNRNNPNPTSYQKLSSGAIPSIEFSDDIWGKALSLEWDNLFNKPTSTTSTTSTSTTEK